MIGAIGGVVCSFSGHFIRSFCVDRLGVHDTVGVMSMHGWPGLVGWLSGVFFLLPINQDFLTGDRQSKNLAYDLPWESVLQHREGNGDAAFAQAVIAPMTIAIALVTGITAGQISKKITHLDRHLLFKDDTFFHVPDDFEKAEVVYGDDDEEVAHLDDEKPLLENGHMNGDKMNGHMNGDAKDVAV